MAVAYAIENPGYVSETGKLRSYKVLHFATHGALAGELEDSSEPGLILSPPPTAKKKDDGHLSASEVAGLKLDADWVILSARNTAGGETKNAEASSGLAKAFFYAGARSLLVSHWYVDSHATLALITKAFDALKRDPQIGRAEALRQAMVSLLNEGQHTWHPASWAPFVVLGEGGNGSISSIRPLFRIVSGAATGRSHAAQEVVGRDFVDLLLPGTEHAHATREIRRVFKGESIRNYETQVVCRNGTLRWVVWNARRLDDFEGEPVVLAIGLDISVR